MREKQLNTNNSKKLIIGISILFCTVILIIGVTTAYFTQSDTKNMENIVTTNINGTLLFDDNNDYMFGNFIPVNEEDVISFASKSSDKCKYQEGMYACNLYEFTITNNSNVSQELKITLNPKINEFGNLYYILLEETKDNISLNSVPVSNDHINGTSSKEIANNVILGPEQSKTFTIVYYVLNLKDIDQTNQDADKQFYANVRVDSITTGTYAGTLMESRCYEYEEITEGEYTGTYKLTSFNGIDENGLADTTCGVTANGEFYSIDVPSKIKDEEGNELEISTLGNKLFSGGIMENKNMIMNPYYTKINNIDIENGIKEIEDGMFDESLGNMYGSFFGIGFNIEDGSIIVKLNISFPNTLKKIGAVAFYMDSVETIMIPKSVDIINDMAFCDSALTKVMFEVDENGSSNLKYIGDGAFNATKLKEVEIPYSVTYIGEYAFHYTETLEKITFLGDLEDSSKNQLTIGEQAFGYANLNYSTYDNPLIIPARVISVGERIFAHSGATYVKFMGSSEALNKLGTNWCTHVDYIKPKDEY